MVTGIAIRDNFRITTDGAAALFQCRRLREFGIENCISVDESALKLEQAKFSFNRKLSLQ
jgi:hypothetical protein